MTIWTATPYFLLWLALVLASIEKTGRVWILCTLLSLAVALFVNIIEPVGMLLVGLLAFSCLGVSSNHGPKWVKYLAWPVLMLTAIGMSVHAFPWIHNDLLYDEVTLTATSSPYTLYWNYDKGLVGLLLYAICIQPQARTNFRSSAVTALRIGLLTILVVLPLASLAGLTSFDPKWPAILFAWIPANLLVTCVAEEAFFRGLLQHRFGAWLGQRFATGPIFALFGAASLFGVAHLAGGVLYALLAALAGLGYGAAYYITGRVEASIAVHFTLNLTHLLLFSYPFLMSATTLP